MMITMMVIKVMVSIEVASVINWNDGEYNNDYTDH